MLDYEPVFLLAGQSNMAGRCNAKDLPLPEEKCSESTKPNNNNNDVSDIDILMCWNNDSNFGQPGTSDGEWKPIQPQFSPGLNMECFGPEMGIAESFCQRLNCERAYFLKFAMGSTNLYSNWNPENSHCESGKPSDIGLYQRFIDFCQTSLKGLNNDADDDDDAARQRQQQQSKKKRRLLAGMFWLQGEGDTSKAKYANAYKANLETFFSAVRKDLSAYSVTKNFPIIVSPVVWHGKKLQVVNDALEEAGNGAIPNCYCIEPIIPSEDWPLLQTEEAGRCVDHLTSPAIMDIGRRMGSVFPVEQLSQK